MRRPVTASSLDTADACIGSVVLDGYDEIHPYSASGTALHTFLEQARADRTAAIAAAPEDDREYFASIDLAAIPAGLSSEVALAYDPERGVGRILERTRNRKYPDLGEGWIYGTADLMGVHDSSLHVPDLKRYRAPRSAADSMQLGFYALAGCAALGIDRAVVSFMVPRADGTWHLDVAELDFADLEAMRQRILDVQLRQAEAAGALSHGRSIALTVGDHCTYCKARRGCPAQVAPLSLAMRADIEGMAHEAPMTYDSIAARVMSLSSEDRGRLYGKAKVASDFLETVLQVLRDDARQQPLPVGGGKELREVAWSHKAKDTEAKEQLAELTAHLEETGHIKSVKSTQVRVVRSSR